MKNFLIIVILLFNISCKAQSTISLEQAYEYSKTTDGIPETVTYVKDINNRLDQFVGIWKGSSNGKTYEIRLEKRVNFGGYSIKWDLLIGKVLIKDNSGNILFNTLNNPDGRTGLMGNTIQNNYYLMSFVANSYCNDSGDVFIEVSKYDSSKMYLNFDKDTGIYNPEKCPNYDTYVTLLPKEKMTLIKQ